MKSAIIGLSLLIVPIMSSAAGVSTLVCENPTKGNRPITFEIKQMISCGFIMAGTVCDWHSGNDQFWSINFDPAVLANLNAGDEVQGTYLEGYLHKDYELTAREIIYCEAK